MKHKFFLSLLAVAAVVVSCQQFDDSSLWEKLYELSEKVSKLEAQCNQMNSDLTNLKSVVSALQAGEYVTACSELADGSGYTIVFSSGKSIVLRNGKDGKDGANASAPKISVRKDSDGVYYWTIDGDWLLDESGMKIKAEGRDGRDGKDGEDGADAVAPQLKIEDGYWYISVDGGKTWTRSGKVTGEDGQDGDTLFRSVTVEDGVLVIILNDDSATRIELPMGVSPDTMVITGDVDEIADFTAKAYGVCRMEDVPGASVIYGIEYSNTDLNSAPVSVRAEGRDSEGSFVCLLSDLMYDTLFYYRAYCFNNGVKSYGEIKTFKTLPIVESVDLGLSVKWRGCNLGASKLSGYGGCYQWAGTQDVTSTSIYLNYANCPYHTGLDSSTGWTKYIPSYKSSFWSGTGSPDDKTVLDPEDDVAHVKLGGKWRMPTKEEWDELRNTSNCSWTWTSINGINGYKVQSKKPGFTNNWIFLPAAGYRDGDFLGTAGSCGFYWSSSLYTDEPRGVYYLDFRSDIVATTYYGLRYFGQSVRPVSE